ncbi:K02A2.6-like [Cordylochernes scorpioides]|uniref:K02A2.6-like n=1 Tax=Cordylochernes scorpioides TaxID=51811 RepID=A0ABY6KGT9_9ARAC|nr:K02A2.6-like [Cordylochernes scorpioides]
MSYTNGIFLIHRIKKKTKVLITTQISCEYDILTEELIRDRIVLGIKDNRVRKKLLMEPKLNLSSAIDICRTAEVTEQQITKLTGQESEDVKWNRKYERKKEATKATNETFTVGRIIGRLHVLRMVRYAHGATEKIISQKYADLEFKNQNSSRQSSWSSSIAGQSSTSNFLARDESIYKRNKTTQYLITVDYYSGFWELDILEHTTSESIIECCKKNFSRHGIPETLITDNGPQFISREFKKTWKVSANYQLTVS